MRIGIIGAGYVGLVTAVCFSELGFEVVCVERDADKLEQLQSGGVPIYEPGVEQMLQRNLASSRLSFTGDMAEAVSDADIVFIAVGTPQHENSDAADLSQVEAAAAELAGHLSNFTVVVIKSTVPVGTTRVIGKLIADANPRADFAMASNPEFLREGAALDDFMKADRIVLGVENARAGDQLRLVYKPLENDGVPLVFTGFESAELIKYSANSFLAMKVTYINQIADLCEVSGADVQDVARGIGLDPRIGSRFLQPGPGIGGSCFPKDMRALSAFAEEAGAPISIIDRVVEVNDARKVEMARRVLDALHGNVAGRKIGVLGITFKPDTDDMREAPSLEIIPALQAAGAAITAYDPVAGDKAKPLLPGVDWASDPYLAAQDADALVIITEWNEFKALDLARISSAMRQPLMIDLRGIYALEDMAETGLVYHSIGRPAVVPNDARRLKAAST